MAAAEDMVGDAAAAAAAITTEARTVGDVHTATQDAAADANITTTTTAAAARPRTAAPDGTVFMCC